MGVIASYETEGIIYGKYILQHMTDAKIGVSYQNDDLGEDYTRDSKRRFLRRFVPSISRRG
jgi:branched-chain amino acid transport system substrate-binding protein